MLCLTVRQVCSAATGRVDDLEAVGFLALHAGVELGHGFVPLGDVAFHVRSIDSVSAGVNTLLKLFFDFFPSQHQARFPHLPQPTHIHT